MDVCASNVADDELWVSAFAGIEKDAVTIFTKYISPDAARPIPITEQIRNDIVGKKNNRRGASVALDETSG